jgi:UDP-N-acetylglucosamine enolpyruvyl transferase
MDKLIIKGSADLRGEISVKGIKKFCFANYGKCSFI